MDIPSEFLNNSALAASKALDNDMRSALAASLPTAMSRTARRLYDSPALKAWQEALGSSVKIDDSALKAAAALANSMKYEHPSASANPPVDALAPPLPPADLEDSPDGVLGVATAKMLMRLRAWGDLCAELGRLCDENVEGLNAGRLEVARQIDECLSCLVMTAGSGGVCWGCGDATLMSHGVVCADCAAPVAQMVLESWFLTEGLEPD